MVIAPRTDCLCALKCQENAITVAKARHVEAQINHMLGVLKAMLGVGHVERTCKFRADRGFELVDHVLHIRALAYYLVAGAVPFLGADVLLSLRFDIMMGPKGYQDGLVPAAIVGLFLGGFYGIVTGRDAGGHQPPPDPPWR